MRLRLASSHDREARQLRQNDVAMAGRVRQPIDEAAFGKFVAENVPQIKTPIELKQVSGG